jgi:predicted Zn-dependent protease
MRTEDSNFNSQKTGNLLLQLIKQYIKIAYRQGGDMATAKEKLAKLLAQQPDDSSYNELIRELAFSAMVQQGLSDSDIGKVISNDEMHKRIRAWRK